jgi:hypothetical protein
MWATTKPCPNSPRGQMPTAAPNYPSGFSRTRQPVATADSRSPTGPAMNAEEKSPSHLQSCKLPRYGVVGNNSCLVTLFSNESGSATEIPAVLGKRIRPWTKDRPFSRRRTRCSRSSALQRQAQPHLASGAIFSVLQRQAPPMCLSDLPAQDKADSQAHGLGREEWDKQVGGVRQAGALILDADIHLFAQTGPAHKNHAPR